MTGEYGAADQANSFQFTMGATYTLPPPK